MVQAATDREVSEQLEQRTAELAIVNSVQNALVEQLDLQGVVEVVGEKIREIFAAQATYIALPDRQTNMIHLPYWREDNHRIVSGPLALGTGLTSIVIQSQQPLLLGTIEELEELGAVTVGEPSRSYLGVPLMSGNSAIGVLSLQSSKDHAFSDSHVRLLSTIAASMSVALENARLFAETRRLFAETDRRAAELATVNAVGQALISELDLDALI